TRIDALRRSLGPMPEKPADLHVHLAGNFAGDGFAVEKLVFESRPGLWVTADLYKPDKPAAAMPGILICHSHHHPKSEGELQDMGESWARRGCLVLVMDVLGHGERRQHPFASKDDFPGSFKVSRQDYFFRYNLGIQLQLVGQSYSGWIAWDLMRGVDLLLARPGVDRGKIILLGSVASGGDLAAITAALDPRIAAVAVFNFGGPQPETRYPLPENAGDSFDYAGSGSWESTRNLPFSARDGFLPWVIDGSIAPRRLIYGHEFSWDKEHDPVWARLGRIYNYYDAASNLVGVHGRGLVTGHPPEASHCNNIGPIQRQDIDVALERWFGIPKPPADEHTRHFSAAELACMTRALADELHPKRVWELASEMGHISTQAGREKLSALPPEDRRTHLMALWTRVLGDVQPPNELVIVPGSDNVRSEIGVAGDAVQFWGSRVNLQVDDAGAARAAQGKSAGPAATSPHAEVSLLILSPPGADAKVRRPVVVAIAQEGHAVFLARRSAAIARLIDGGAIVCLADLRGAGDSARAGDDRDRTSQSTDVAASYLMLGQPLLGQRLRDLRCVLKYLRGDRSVDPARIALWGESFASPNAPERRVDVPYGADPFPAHSEPMAGMVVLLGGLYEPEIRAICVNGGLTGYQSVLQSPFLYVPADVIVPGVLGPDGPGDLCDVAAALAPRALRMTALVDGRNRLAERQELDAVFAPARSAYGTAKAAERLEIESTDDPAATATWLLKELR
ncbi:MAG TPA: acetylxylan esterase, partial [Tepidisphaeraceae bacterium]|nr:acetylxylan esterase [Tepidisphaeraceae bacterium]